MCNTCICLADTVSVKASQGSQGVYYINYGHIV